ncbi:hypothetical protein CEP51_016356 [Fusarium floridanum]|uniref:IDI-2 n=1 Tax=Fusarium floridanum TaxID=1325733 RepID=A0A428NRR1_9HYPO|nr:hypothetical protein CEP51_016356 [Fusarium floridanum]
MKLSAFYLFAYHTACALALPASNAQAECGELGVMDWTNVEIPDTVNRTNLRTCKEHPATLTTIKERDNILQERRCIPPGKKQKWGCDQETGYCWMNCGKVKKGEWCWEAFEYGIGAWSNCKTDLDCFRNTERGARCSIGDCESCGCGC